MTTEPTTTEGRATDDDALRQAIEFSRLGWPTRIKVETCEALGNLLQWHLNNDNDGADGKVLATLLARAFAGLNGTPTAATTEWPTDLTEADREREAEAIREAQAIWDATPPMTLILAILDGHALVYHTKDVEKMSFETPADVIDITEPEDTSIRRKLGQRHLHLHIDFKGDKQARWMPLAKALTVAGKGEV